jgi:D-alanyl-D-alanine carboxypeptidase
MDSSGLSRRTQESQATVRQVDIMNSVDRLRRHDEAYHVITLLLAIALVPVARLIGGCGSARHLACQWALAARFPAEDLSGLTPATRAAFEAARTRALWQHGELIGLTSGYRTPARQAHLFDAAVRSTGSPEAAREWVLPPDESRHVAGTALDVRPTEGARWLEEHGAPHGLYRIYDNEWWHFEYRPEGRPERLPHSGVRRSGVSTA